MSTARYRIEVPDIPAYSGPVKTWVEKVQESKWRPKTKRRIINYARTTCPIRRQILNLDGNVVEYEKLAEEVTERYGRRARKILEMMQEVHERNKALPFFDPRVNEQTEEFLPYLEALLK